MAKFSHKKIFTLFNQLYKTTPNQFNTLIVKSFFRDFLHHGRILNALGVMNINSMFLQIFSEVLLVNLKRFGHVFKKAHVRYYGNEKSEKDSVI